MVQLIRIGLWLFCYTNKYFSSWLNTFCNSISSATNCTFATMNEIKHYHVYRQFICRFQFWVITPNFCSVLIDCRRCLTRSALGDIDLRFSFVLVTTANAVEEETTWAACFCHQRNQSLHVTVGGIKTSLSASLQQKISAVTIRRSEISFNWKLSRKLERLCKF